MKAKSFLPGRLALLMSFSLVSASQEKPSIEQIIERHIQALGGQQKIDAIHTIVYHLTYREGTFVMPDGYMAKMRPYYKTLGDPKNLKVEVNEGYDGSAWEYYSDPGVVLRTVCAAAAATRHGTELIDSLADAKALGAHVELADAEPFAGRPAYKVHVTLADGFEKDLFVDTQSFLIAGDRHAALVHAFGAVVRSENRFGDYRPVNGVLFPFTVQEVEIATGKELNSVTYHSIIVNEKFEASYFSPPQYNRTSLQQMLEQLYMERSDSLSVLWTYHGFRAANPAIETREGVEFIGYQMAKMGDLNGAIELLKANAADYPKSASAQYELGRAYKAAGDAHNARVSFEKALEIDPNFKKASDGLNAVR
jgi:tetratricopeptide (TPR) repeat protein